ncbi:hypothetical protein DSL72_009346 [Monilinia vaccinii-corymbosi]|uniref:N-acetyltransferase domain-containing protein n=1 Tax=Monilinia vaccinii-corymbosi TaxID=61207 RepID=A0A8A3PP42_9HELO|nr:hypothetical protein DSL72_009346 [Monilinia vaccinii-corymbosi]
MWVELGHVLFAQSLQRTTGATEACYVLMGYERLEWKCSTENEPSRRAALRLGFVGEGVFRRHMVVRGRRRDSWGGSVILEEWAVVKGALVEWLGVGNFDGEGRQKRKLEEVREELRRGMVLKENGGVT